MADIDAILKELVERRGSDLHLKVGRPPLFRIAGDLIPTEKPPITRNEMEQILRTLLGNDGFETLRATNEADENYLVEGVGRFRINAFRRMGEFGMVLRHIPLEIPSIDGLKLPPVLKDIAAAPQGMILVTGPTGSGKSTTLAAMIRHLNETEHLHIITIEDPIEFVYTDNKCTINQRQLGKDVPTLHEALRRALRQNPDVILVGEMRDAETIELAMHAAETGHLVFSTLHTNDAKQTIDRIIDSFPSDAHAHVRAMLAMTLHAVISQRLVRRADGAGRAVAMEILINTPFIRELIAEGKIAQIDKEIAKGADQYRMQTFNQALAALVHEGTITEEEAMSISTSPNDLKLLIKGVSRGATSTVAAPSAQESGKLKITRGF
jgi:twitching motility protein PilT